MASQLCSEVNGGGCKNKVSARNGFVCSAGHSGNGVARPTIPISKMEQWDKEALAENPSISEDLQLELFRTGDKDVHWKLSQNPSIGEDLQWELFRTGDISLQQWLAYNPSIGEDLQWELFRTENMYIRNGITHNPSISRDIAIELAKAYREPYGYTKNKSLAELVSPENLVLLNQYPRAFGDAYLIRLLDYPQEDKEESKALTLHSYLVYERSGGKYAEAHKNKILKRYGGDQEVALILGGASQ